jgi:long-chain acyl-CoA synthetase
VATPVLFLLTEDELRHVLADSGAVAIVTTPEFLPKILNVADGPSCRRGGEGGGPTTFAELESGDELGIVDRTPEDLAALLYTGGTTGRSKGVALTHAGLDAAGAAGYAAAHEPGRTVGLLPLPLAHVYGLMCRSPGCTRSEAGRSRC